ncbi:unnamed protein product [Amoebophrya sp. A25]|nr:unnamed protein product [Amoebophrya sp. A25]|eukprot:GSA25T00001418001.1
MVLALAIIYLHQAQGYSLSLINHKSLKLVLSHYLFVVSTYLATTIQEQHRIVGIIGLLGS